MELNIEELNYVMRIIAMNLNYFHRQDITGPADCNQFCCSPPFFPYIFLFSHQI